MTNHLTSTSAAAEDQLRNAPARAHARRRRAIAVLAIAGLGLAALAACSSSAKTTTGRPSASNAAGAPTGYPGTGRGGPAAFGVAAAISGKTIEVQDPATGQVSVTYSASTTFTQAKKVSPSTLTAGDCVTAIGQPAAAGSATSSSAAHPTSFTATSITVLAAINGSCTAGFGSGTRPAGSARPSGAPTGNTPGSTRAQFGTFATGKVVSVSGATIVIHTTNRTTQATTTDTITATSATIVTATTAATAAALKVGECVSATGPANTTGTVAATRISLSTPGPNGCTTRFGRRGGSTSTGGPNA